MPQWRWFTGCIANWCGDVGQDSGHADAGKGLGATLKLLASVLRRVMNLQHRIKPTLPSLRVRNIGDRRAIRPKKAQI